MTYPHVIQFETRALEAEAQTRLADERLAARPSTRGTEKRRFVRWLPLRPRGTLQDCVG